MAEPGVTPDVVDAFVRVPDREALRTLLVGPVDVGCTAGPRSVGDAYELNVIVSRDHFDDLVRAGLDIREVARSGGATTADVGSGDRYHDHHVVPRGVAAELGWIRWIAGSRRRWTRT